MAGLSNLRALSGALLARDLPRTKDAVLFLAEGVDLPEVVSEVKAVFERYEKALVSNDIATLDELFRPNALTIRYGVAENLYGHDEVGESA